MLTLFLFVFTFVWTISGQFLLIVSILVLGDVRLQIVLRR
jgi:hypothetical protein